MRLTKAVITQVGGERRLETHFSVHGIEASASFVLPDAWDTFGRAQKIAWGKAQVAAHLEGHAYHAAYQALLPDAAAAEDAKDNFDALPGWATWTPDEARTWIAENVRDLATAKHVIGEMAAAILYLRNIVIER